MRNIKYIFILMLLVTAWNASAQSGNILTQTLTWHSTSGYDSLASDSTHATMRFTTVSADRIEHRNHNNVLQTFDITSTTGTWTDVGIAGSMTYHVTHTGVTGIVRITRSAEGVFLSVDFTASGGVKINYIINTVE